MKKLLFLIAATTASAIFGAGTAEILSEQVDGVTWYYSVQGTVQQGQMARIEPVPLGGVPYAGDLIVPTALGGYTVKTVHQQAFANSAELKSIVFPDQITSAASFASCANLVSIKFPSGLTTFPMNAIQGCTSLVELIIPEGVKSVSSSLSMTPVNGVPYSLKHVVFPSTIEQFACSFFPSTVVGKSNAVEIDFNCPCLSGTPAFFERGGFCWRCKRENFPAFKRAVPLDLFAGFLEEGKVSVNVISSEIRKSDPTIIDLVYKVTSKSDSVNVRVVAFEDGERSFAKAVVPMTFVDGTDANIGDGVAANVEHKISWQVSSDWAADLAKVKVEVLTVENGLLPLELMTLPALDGHVACEFSWNAISLSSAFDALLWLYADHDSDISVEEGVVRRVSDGAVIARGGEVYPTAVNYRTTQTVDGRTVTVTETRGSAIAFELGKMGYSLLGGDDLAHVNSISRLGLQPVDANTISAPSPKPVVAAQIYAYKEVN